MLASFCRWLPHTGHSGFLVVLDFRPYEYTKIAKGKRQQEPLERLREAIARGTSAAELTSLVNDESQAEPDIV